MLEDEKLPDLNPEFFLHGSQLRPGVVTGHGPGWCLQIESSWAGLVAAGTRGEAAGILAACTCKIFWCGFVSSHHQVWHRHDQHYKWYHYQSWPGLVSVDTRCLMPQAGGVRDGDICGPHDDFFKHGWRERATDGEKGGNHLQFEPWTLCL